MADLTRNRYCLRDILQGTLPCKNPTITWGAEEGISIPCIDGECIDIEILDGFTEHCVTVTIDCEEDCSDCPSITQRICFCATSDDCGDCEYCNGNGLCVSFCADGKICDNDTCVDCTSDAECTCNQVCLNGECVCPPDMPIERIDGCCVECELNSQCPPCYICQNGACVPKDCGTFVCDPNNGDCGECFANSHCTGQNECCVNNLCECCPGFYLNPQTGLCEEIPPCFTNADCPECFDCINGECVARQCPGGLICLNDICVPPCNTGEDCPPGQGCLNGTCVPCSDLSCTAEGPQCVFALGCECVDGLCQEGNCDISTLGFEWVYSPPTPGTILDPGLPELTASVTITPAGLETAGGAFDSNFQNHDFTVNITNGTTGGFTLYNTPTSGSPLGTGLSTTFDLLTGPAQYNFAGFQVQFIENGTGRVLDVFFYMDPNAELTAENSWSYVIQSTGTPPTSSGGSSGSLQLCPTNGSFDITNVVTTSTTGTIQLFFTPVSGGCANVAVSGCGIWNGEVTVECAGQSYTFPAPEFVIPEDNCCDPITDLNCGFGTGDPCITPTVVTIPLIARAAFNATGKGEFNIIADWQAAGLTYPEWFFVNPSPSCWSTTGNPDFGNVNDIELNAGNFGTHPNAQAQNIIFGEAGCVTLGKTCTLSLTGCRRLEGEICLDECSEFAVKIFETGTLTYIAIANINDEPVTYLWSTNLGALGTAQTETVASDSNINYIRVDASSGDCNASDQIALSITVFGCTNPLACNYNALANQDDGTCVLVNDPTYSCTSGIQFDDNSGGTTTYRINGITYNQGEAIPAAIGAVVEATVMGGFTCSKTIDIPQCYQCSGASCIGANPNLGLYTDDPLCGGVCNCQHFTAVLDTCVGNRVDLLLTTTGGSGTYDIIVREGNATGPIIFNQTGTIAPVTITGLCNNTYHITVDDGVCIETYSHDPTCAVCANAPLGIDSVVFSCETPTSASQISFTIQGDDSCPTAGVMYNVSVRTADCGMGATVVASQSYGSTGSYTIQFPGGTDPVDGTYYIIVEKIIKGLTCCASDSFLINCGGNACQISVNSLVVAPGTPGFLDAFVTWTQSAGSGTVNWTLYSDDVDSCPNDCSGPDLPTTSIQSGIDATGSFTVSNILDLNEILCWRVVLTDSVTGACVGELSICRDGSLSPAPCTIDVTNVVYNSANESFEIEWTSLGTLSGPTNGLEVTFSVYPTAACIGTPVTFTYTGLGEFSTGLVEFGVGNFPQLESTVQCVSVSISDPFASGCILTTLNDSIPACTCSVPLVSTSYNVATQEIIVDYAVTCPTSPTDITIQVDLMNDASCSSLNSNLFTRTAIANASGVEFFSVPETPTAQYIKVTVFDSTLTVACTANDCYTLGACATCASQEVSLVSSRFNQVIDTNSNLYTVTGLGPGFVECANPSTVNDNWATDLETVLNAVDTCGTAVVTWALTAGAGDATTCRSEQLSHTDAGTVGINVLDVIANGTSYLSTIQYGQMTGGVPALIPTGAQAIADHIEFALTSEGVPFDFVVVRTGITGSNVTLEIEVSGLLPANTLSIEAGVVGSESTTAFDALCTAPTGTQSGTTPSTLGCVTFTVTGSGIFLDTISDFIRIYNWDRTNC